MTASQRNACSPRRRDLKVDVVEVRVVQGAHVPADHPFWQRLNANLLALFNNAAICLVIDKSRAEIDHRLVVPGRNIVEIDELVLTKIPDRSHKVQAPEALKPTARFGDPTATSKHFEESRDKTETVLKTTPDLRGHVKESPLGVKLDGYEWILYIGAHSDRHTKQILEVKADPNYPKS